MLTECISFGKIDQNNKKTGSRKAPFSDAKSRGKEKLLEDLTKEERTVYVAGVSEKVYR